MGRWKHLSKRSVKWKVSKLLYCVHDIIRFVGNGEDGLLVYCLRLSQLGNSHLNQISYLNTVLENFQAHKITLENKIQELENSNKQLKTQLKTLKETPVGLRERIRQMKQINNLSETCGGRKKRMKLARDYIAKVSGLDMHNSEERIQLLNETMNRSDIVKLLKLPENHKLRTLALQELVKDMNSRP